MSFDLPHWSRFIETQKILWNNNNTFGLYINNDVINNLEPDDLINFKVTTGYAGRPDLISNEHYNTPYYAWVIVMHNAPLNPVGWPKVGDLISIPTRVAMDKIIHG